MASSGFKWLFLVYMAGDNGKVFEQAGGQLLVGMEGAGKVDLAEMEAVGSTGEVAVLAQFDTLSTQDQTYRITILPGGLGREVEAIPEQNTGDPKALREFILWGMERCPAERTALVLWNHGAGWKEEDIYAFARSRGVEPGAPAGEMRSTSCRRRFSRALFRTSLGAVLAIRDEEKRAIAYDDSSMDFLDNQELKKALQQVKRKTKKKIDLLGMDACLMSMLEIAYQLRGVARVLVGSQEVEPMAGWPYAQILDRLVESPEVSPEELGRWIAQEYGKSFQAESGYLPEAPVTQSAIRLSGLRPVAQALQQLSQALLPLLEAEDPALETALFGALKKSLRFKDSDYVDLGDFLQNLNSRYFGEDPALRSALDRAGAVFTPEGPDNPVLERVALGGAEGRACGLSIYLPVLKYSPFYDRLDFARLGWAQFVRALNNVQ